MRAQQPQQEQQQSAPSQPKEKPLTTEQKYLKHKMEKYNFFKSIEVAADDTNDSDKLKNAVIAKLRENDERRNALFTQDKTGKLLRKLWQNANRPEGSTPPPKWSNRK